MSYLTAIDSTPVYEFPYSGPQSNTIPLYNVDINVLLSSITPPLADLYYNPAPTYTLQCTPQINPNIDSSAVVYQVPENVPIASVLQQFGIDTSTLQPSNSVYNYYRSVSQPIDVTIHTNTNRRRRFVCREVSDDSEDDNYQKRPERHHRQHYNTWSNRSKQPPTSIHNILSKVWNKAERASQPIAPSASAPNLNWQSMRNNTPPQSPQPPPNYHTNNAWQAMRNSPPPMSQDHRNAVNNVWNRADNASQQNTNLLSNVFNRMQQPTGGIMNRPPPQNREAVHDFYAARNLPPGINQPQQNREAVHDFYAARNLPPGINQPQQNREAVHDFYAARNLPPGINQPQQNREAVHDFYAARNLPPNINQPPPFLLPPSPPQNREAVQNFFAARNLPPGINQQNSAVSNVWNRAHYAPPQTPPMNYPWNRTQQGAPFRPNSSFPYPPNGVPSRGPSSVPAPASFGALLAQAHRQQSHYAGAA